MTETRDRVEEVRWEAHMRVHEVAERNVDRRLSDMNELRKQISDERGIYVTRGYFDLQHDSMRRELASLARTVWMGLGGVLVISFLLSLFFHA